MGRTLGINTLLGKEYPTFELSPKWIEAIGLPEQNFRAIIWGPSGGGKTTFALLLCKELSAFGKVYYNTVEQGEGKSLQDAVKRCKMEECKAGSIMFGDKDTFSEMMEKLKKNRAKFCVIDSLQYANLTTEQYKTLIKVFPKKAFIIISWEGAGAQPKGEYAKAIRYMVDIKIHVNRGVAHTDSRFGPTKPYRIFEPKSGQQLDLLNQ